MLGVVYNLKGILCPVPSLVSKVFALQIPSWEKISYAQIDVVVDIGVDVADSLAGFAIFKRNRYLLLGAFHEQTLDI